MYFRFFCHDWIDDTGLFDMRLRTRIKIKLKGRTVFPKLYNVTGKKFGSTGSEHIIYICSVFALAVINKKTLRICAILNYATMITTDSIFLNRIKAYIVFQSTTYTNFRIVFNLKFFYLPFFG